MQTSATSAQDAPEAGLQELIAQKDARIARLEAELARSDSAFASLKRSAGPADALFTRLKSAVEAEPRSPELEAAWRLLSAAGLEPSDIA